MSEISGGDRVRFVPKNPKRMNPQEGVVVDEVNGGDGYNVLVPLEGDPHRVLRLWRRDGDFVLVEKYVAPESPPAKPVMPPVPRSPREEVRAIDLEPEDAARKYRAQGLSVRQAWNQYVIDCGLRPQFDMKKLVKAWGR